MNLFEYQQLAARTIPDTLDGDDLYLNAVLGMNGEAGEMADMLKKALFQGHAYTEEQKINEAGDVLWYIAAACTALGVSLETVAEQNIAKLRQRYPDGFDVERSVFRDDGPASQNEVVNEHPIEQEEHNMYQQHSGTMRYNRKHDRWELKDDIYPQGKECIIIVADGGHDSATYISTAADHTLQDYQDGSGVE